MTMLAPFVFCFFAGPLIFLLFWRKLVAPKSLALIALFCAAIGALISELGSVWASATSLGVIWFGWICALTAGAQALARFSGLPKVSRIAGTVGVTAPWFGFATTHWMVG